MKKLTAFLLIVMGLLVFPAHYAAAALMVVDTTQDSLTSGNQKCSLREAIMNANADSDTTEGDCPAGDGQDEIWLPQGTYVLTYHSDLEISQDLIIRGAAERDKNIIDGAEVRVFHISREPPDYEDVTVEIANLTIRNGRSARSGSTEGKGGGILVTDGANLLLTNSVITGSGATTASGFAGGFGGGIHLSGGIYTTGSGFLTIIDSEVSGNFAGEAGGGIYSSGDGLVTIIDSVVSNNSATIDAGGGIYIQRGELNLDGSTVASNDSGSGAGIYSATEQTTVVNSTISSNVARLGGGGIYADGTNLFNTDTNLLLTNSVVSGNLAEWDYGGGIYSTGSGFLTIIDSEVSGNSAPKAGGGIYKVDGPLNLDGSTIAGNTAGDGSGAGIYAGANGNIINSTISGNLATNFGGGIFTYGLMSLDSSTIAYNTADGAGGGIYQVNVVPDVKNTIIANNTNGDCDLSIQNNGGNLDSDGTCSFAITGDPLLGPLLDNGGPTRTHALLLGSPAIDTGSPDCPLPAIDQRGVARLQGCRCDSGAYEFENQNPPDNQPPSPDPMTFEIAPFTVSANEISMTATEVVDYMCPPVSYAFSDMGSPTGGGGAAADGNFRANRVFTDSALDGNHQYCYRIRASDSASPPNLTDFSETLCAYTLANLPAGPVVFSNITESRIQIDFGANGNSPSTVYIMGALRGITVLDDGGSVTDTTWTAQGLSCGADYNFVAFAENDEGIMTTESVTLGTARTLACPPVPDTDGDGVLDDTDNCILVPNADQRNTDGDFFFGNICDADFNNNGVVDSNDASVLFGLFGKTSSDPEWNPNGPHVDMNGNGVIDSNDASRLFSTFGQHPGPSGLLP